MARIPEAELQHLKAAVPLVAVVRSQGRQMVKKGKDSTVLCPFHDEKTPSMVISPSKNLYHCFGCNAGGSVLDWVMHTEKLSLRKAVERLRGEPGDNSAVAQLVTKDEPEVFTEDEAGRQLLPCAWRQPGPPVAVRAAVGRQRRRFAPVRADRTG